MRSILEEFANGNISPEARSFRPGSQYAKALQQVVDSEENLVKTLTEKQIALFKEFEDKQADVTSLSCTDKFVHGYKLGVLMTMEVFFGMENLLFNGSM